MAKGTRQGGQPGQPERAAGEMMLADWGITYRDAGTDEHMLNVMCRPVGLGELVEEDGEPIVRDATEPVGNLPLQDCDYTLVLNETLFRLDEEQGWLIEEMSDDA